MITPTARSTTLPRIANSLNSLIIPMTVSPFPLVLSFMTFCLILSAERHLMNRKGVVPNPRPKRNRRGRELLGKFISARASARRVSPVERQSPTGRGAWPGHHRWGSLSLRPRRFAPACNNRAQVACTSSTANARCRITDPICRTRAPALRVAIDLDHRLPGGIARKYAWVGGPDFVPHASPSVRCTSAP